MEPVNTQTTSYVIGVNSVFSVTADFNLDFEPPTATVLLHQQANSEVRIRATSSAKTGLHGTGNGMTSKALD